MDPYDKWLFNYASNQFKNNNPDFFVCTVYDTNSNCTEQASVGSVKS